MFHILRPFSDYGLILDEISFYISISLSEYKYNIIITQNFIIALSKWVTNDFISFNLICGRIFFDSHFWRDQFIKISDYTHYIHKSCHKNFSFPIQILLLLISFSSLFVWVGSFDLHVVCYHAAQKEEEVKEDIYHHQQL